MVKESVKLNEPQLMTHGKVTSYFSFANPEIFYTYILTKVICKSRIGRSIGVAIPCNTEHGEEWRRERTGRLRPG